MGLGGMYLKPLTADQRTERQLAAGAMALKVEHVGQYAPHDEAKKAGVRNGDVLVSFNGRSDLLRDTDLLAYALNQIKPGTSVPIVVLRDSEPIGVPDGV